MVNWCGLVGELSCCRWDRGDAEPIIFFPVTRDTFYVDVLKLKVGNKTLFSLFVLFLA